VNYHFGDKLGLYREVLRSSHASLESHPTHGGGNLPARERLRMFVHAFLTHLFGEGRPTWFAQVIAHEMAQPTPALKELIELEARPGFERLKQMISDISGLSLDDDRVRLCANSVMGQCPHYFHSRIVVAELCPEIKMTPDRIEQIANYITTFSLAGVAGARHTQPKLKGARKTRTISTPRRTKKKQ
jgi:hypothetical protein